LTDHENKITCVKFSHDEKEIISCSLDKSIKFWNRKLPELIRSLEGENGLILKTHLMKNE